MLMWPSVKMSLTPLLYRDQLYRMGRVRQMQEQRERQQANRAAQQEFELLQRQWDGDTAATT